MAGVGVEIEGLRQFRNGLRRAGSGWTRVLADVNKDVARHVERETKGGYLESAQQVKAEGALSGRGSTAAAKIVIGGSPPFALGAFMGALQYRQFPKWVGNTWDVGGAGGPPPNAAIRDSKQDIVDAYGDAFEYVARAAFPDGIPARKSPIFKGSGAF